MARIDSFEDLEVWKSGMDLAEMVYKLTNTTELSKDFGLRDQIRRSAVSVPSNISEGFERNANNQFIYFLVIAKGSCGECRTQLNLAFRLGYIDKKTHDIVSEKCLSTSKQLGGFITYLKSVKKK